MVFLPWVIKTRMSLYSCLYVYVLMCGKLMDEQSVSGNVAYRHCVEAMAGRFFAFLDAKPKTVETYSRALRRFFHFLADRSITQPVREDVLAFREELRTRCKPGTVQLYIIAVRQFFKWTAQEGLFPNIAENIKGAKLDRGHKKDYLTSAQARDILNSVKRDSVRGLRDYAILALMLTTGLRTIEVARANIEDMKRAGDSTVLYIQGKGRDGRAEYVKVAAPAERAIRDYLTAAGTPERGLPLFGSLADKNKGRTLSTRSVSRIVKMRLRAAGYDDERLSAHSLRHTAGTLNLLNGGTLEETQQLLRHSNINTTMIYIHHLQRAANNSEDRIAAAIFT